MTEKFNHRLLLIGRQVRGYSQADLAKNSGLTQGHLSKIENGLTEPSHEIVGRMASFLDFPESYFYQSDPVYGLPLSVHPMHRKRAAVGQKPLGILHAELNIRLMHIRRLLRSVEHKKVMQLPKLDVDEYGGDARKIAELVRRAWLLPGGPIENLTSTVEQAGIIVVLTSFAETGIDGVSLATPELPPCIFLNMHQPADRMRFTLAHELGHLVMHELPNPEMEHQSNDFASELLMPSSELKARLAGRVDLALLANLKPHWRVSIQALLMRAKDLGVVSEFQSRSLWKQISTSRMRLREPPELDFPQEEPTVLPQIIRLHLEQLGYSVSELASVLHVHEAELQRLYLLSGKQPGVGHLRIV